MLGAAWRAGIRAKEAPDDDAAVVRAFHEKLARVVA
jgi:hypothetical protein